MSIIEFPSWFLTLGSFDNFNWHRITFVMIYNECLLQQNEFKPLLDPGRSDAILGLLKYLKIVQIP